MKLIRVTSEELVAASIEDLLAQPEDSFQPTDRVGPWQVVDISVQGACK